MIHIITGSTLGSAEYVGDHLDERLQQQGHETEIHNQPDLADIPAEGIWLIITSTHGAGEYPDNIQPFIRAIQDTPPRTDQLSFAVIAIGDSSYDTFCAAGKHAYELLLDIGATPLTDCYTIDITEHPVPEDAAGEWLTQHIEQFNSSSDCA
ncbi:FMN-binding protein MioC [Vibrio spartinae]|uniref:Sulfite reductase [NADPH] flavoprotein alpha-component n=1 Tax=Vibrio spartinae TaxID=1918945 RepID=A0A1N6M7R8_9VIBR|nr:FMN-binding protein MioC [Vibrio spartinae]SIO95482.1 Sulfite reductase [NADPH] flavoprotein alpha-component [Vibrio spartinae]